VILEQIGSDLNGHADIVLDGSNVQCRPHAHMQRTGSVDATRGAVPWWGRLCGLTRQSQNESQRTDLQA
jgi:hypothetical protein